LDLDAWRDAALKEIEEAKVEALTEISTMDASKISERMERVLMDSAYIIQLPETATPKEAEHFRSVVEALGAHCVVVTADTMKIISLSAKFDN